MSDSKADIDDQVALHTPSGRRLGGWASAVIFGMAVAALVAGFMEFGPTEPVPVFPLVIGAIAAFLYAKVARLALLPALAMCAVAVAYVVLTILMPPESWGARHPIAHYIANAVAVLFAVQGLRAALAERRARRAASA